MLKKGSSGVMRTTWKKADEFKALLDKCGEKMSTSTVDKAVELAIRDMAYVSQFFPQKS